MSERTSARPSPSGGGRAASGPASWRPWHRPSALVAAAIAVPVVVVGFAVSLRGWYPTLDDAYITTRAYDVWTSRTPSLGQYSLTGRTGGPTVHSPGPLLYWLVSIPARLGPPWLIPAFMAVVGAALLAWVVALARRRGGAGFMWVTAVGLVLLVRALGPALIVGVWNPWAALVPFTALVFVCWSVADGERRLLPVAVLLASFAIQAHLTYAFASVGLLLVAVAGGWGLDRWNAPRPEADDVDGEPVDHQGRWWLPLLASVGVGVLCWALPLHQQVTNHPGNLTLIARSGSERVARGGAGAAVSSLWRTVGIPPKFARGEASPADEVASVLRSPSLAAMAGCLVILLVVSAVAALAVRRRDRTVVGGAAVVAALLGGLLPVADKLPRDQVYVAAYTFRWFAVASLVTWLVVGLGVVRLVVAPRLARTAPRRAHSDSWSPSPAVASAGVVVGAVGLLVVGLALPRRDPAAFAYEPGRDLAAVLQRDTEPGGTYLVGRSGPFDVAYTSVEVWALRSAGRFPVFGDRRGDGFAPGYGTSGRRCDGILVLAAPSDARLPGARTLARIAVKFPPKVMRVDLAPDRTGNGAC